MLKEQKSNRLTGRMLIAMPHMADPRFYKTTLAVVKHDASGASAVIFNKPSKSLNLNEVCLDMGYKCIDRLKKTPIWYGGPINTSQIFVLHSTDYHDKESVVVCPGINITSNKFILQTIAEGKGPKLFKIVVGCAIWSPEQLDDELEGAWPRNGLVSWLHTKLEINNVFADDDCWSDSIDTYSQHEAKNILKRLEVDHAKYTY
tara:strand:+ start:959 stop:1567 length:609 start_codon:yes stop_codon:yes gene_type:complete